MRHAPLIDPRFISYVQKQFCGILVFIFTRCVILENLHKSDKRIV